MCAHQRPAGESGGGAGAAWADEISPAERASAAEALRNFDIILSSLRRPGLSRSRSPGLRPPEGLYSIRAAAPVEQAPHSRCDGRDPPLRCVALACSTAE